MVEKPPSEPIWGSFARTGVTVGPPPTVTQYGLNFPGMVYEPCYSIFARPISINPVNSQPGAGWYNGRGIFDTNSIEVVALDGSLYSDTRTELDILQYEFPILPQQGDVVSIPQDMQLPGGTFEISDATPIGNAGGEVTLTLRRLVEWRLVGMQYFLPSPEFARPPFTESGLNWGLESPFFGTPTIRLL